MEPRFFQVWITIQKAADLPGQWMAHCLDVDVVTYGSSARHAFKMIEEATAMVIEDDLSRGQDPLLRRAPEEDWARLRELNSRAVPMAMDALDADHSGTFVIQMPLQFVPHPVEPERSGIATSAVAARRGWDSTFETPLFAAEAS